MFKIIYVHIHTIYILYTYYMFICVKMIYVRIHTVCIFVYLLHIQLFYLLVLFFNNVSIFTFRQVVLNITLLAIHNSMITFD